METNGTDRPDEQAQIGDEDVANAETRPEADIRTTRPVDDPEAIGGSEYYADSETGQEQDPAPVEVVDDADAAIEQTRE